MREVVAALLPRPIRMIPLPRLTRADPENDDDAEELERMEMIDQPSPRQDAIQAVRGQGPKDSEEEKSPSPAASSAIIEESPENLDDGDHRYQKLERAYLRPIGALRQDIATKGDEKGRGVRDRDRPSPYLRISPSLPASNSVTNAFTTSGSNCPPEPFLISATAASAEIFS
jgi:hypothetical protein